MKTAFTLFRIAYGAWFLFWGLAPFLGIKPPATTQPDAVALLEANRAAFPMQLASASFIVGGAALIWKRTAPLGVAILAPTVVWIFLFHVTLTADYPWAAFWLVGLIILGFRMRKAYRPLVTWKD
ncbi:hypothetical protein [Sphingomicrobium arenosum]|uniref:hypothetical protein n=1 Tax=Sphingomicrobium arenosum TaxID=2233861 RepID=UPI002240EFB3|nr:hypothetical protein [Sphingomicrobium arenosum]